MQSLSGTMKEKNGEKLKNICYVTAYVIYLHYETMFELQKFF